VNINQLFLTPTRVLRSVLLAICCVLAPFSVAQEYTVNLKDTDIQEFIKFVADVTGTTMVVDPNVKGKVRVISSQPVTQSELYDLFMSILDVQGYTAVRSGKVIRIVPAVKTPAHRPCRSWKTRERWATTSTSRKSFGSTIFRRQN
jgi:type II secretory pathway component GspD/PulD (secretin)